MTAFWIFIENSFWYFLNSSLLMSVKNEILSIYEKKNLPLLHISLATVCENYLLR